MLLECRVPRVKTEDNKIRQIDVPWAGKSNGFTLLFETLLMQLCCKIPVTMRLYVTEGKDHTTIERFAKDLEAHNGDRENITDVSCDMSPAFIKGVEKNLKNAKITFDKFHLVKIISEAVGGVRKTESKENQALKGTRNIFYKNRENITVAQLKYLQEKLQLKGLRLKTVRAFHLRKSFQEICQSETKNEFISRLNKWYLCLATHCRLEPMKKAAKTIKEHWNGVIRWYDSRVNNAFLRGLIH